MLLGIQKHLHSQIRMKDLCMITVQGKYYFTHPDMRLPAKFKFCIFSQLRSDSADDKKTTTYRIRVNLNGEVTHTALPHKHTHTPRTHSPKVEILFADKLSTDRWRRDARGAKVEILLTERSSRSRFIHSPMHPSSCIPARRPVDS